MRAISRPSATADTVPYGSSSGSSGSSTVADALVASRSKAVSAASRSPDIRLTRAPASSGTAARASRRRVPSRPADETTSTGGPASSASRRRCMFPGYMWTASRGYHSARYQSHWSLTSESFT